MKIDENAEGFQMERLMGNGKVRVYEAIKVKPGTIGMWLNRATLYGNIPEKDSPILFHVLDKHQNRIQEIPINKGGFKYIKNKLKIKIVEVLE